MITSTITWIELLYTVMAFIGLLMDAALAHQTFLDYQSLMDLKLNGGRKIVAIGNLRNATGRGAIQFTEVMLGAYAMALPSEAARLSIVAVVLLVIATILLLLSAFDHQERNALKSDFIKYGRRRTDNPDYIAVLEHQLAAFATMQKQGVRLREKDAALREEDAHLRDRDDQMSRQTQEILDKIEQHVDDQSQIDDYNQSQQNRE